jgi:hypothetical protein
VPVNLRSLASWYWYLLRWHVGAQDIYEWAMRAVCLLAGHCWEQCSGWMGGDPCSRESYKPGETRVCLRCGRWEEESRG